jgi:hypothetical protein
MFFAALSAFRTLSLSVMASVAVMGRGPWTLLIPWWGAVMLGTWGATEGAAEIARRKVATGIFDVAASVPLFSAKVPSGGDRVTQFYDPSRGPYGPSAQEALTADPKQGLKGLRDLIFEGSGARGPRTWVSPRSAPEQDKLSRLLTGRPEYSDYVEFTALPGETRPVGGLKRMLGLGAFQEYAPGRVHLAGRDPQGGVLAPFGTFTPAELARTASAVYVGERNLDGGQ